MTLEDKKALQEKLDALKQRQVDLDAEIEKACEEEDFDLCDKL